MRMVSLMFGFGVVYELCRRCSTPTWIKGQRVSSESFFCVAFLHYFAKWFETPPFVNFMYFFFWYLRSRGCTQILWSTPLNTNHLEMYLLLKTVIYHCDVSFQGCNMRVVHQGIRFVWQPFQWASWMSLGCSFWWIGFSSIGDSGQKAVIWESWSVPVTSRCFWYG